MFIKKKKKRKKSPQTAPIVNDKTPFVSVSSKWGILAEKEIKWTRLGTVFMLLNQNGFVTHINTEQWDVTRHN